MEQYIKQSSFRKHLNLILLKLKLALRTDLEYKTNLWMMLIENTLLIGVYTLFYSIYNSFTKEIIPWTKLDFIILLMLLLMSGQIKWSFSITKFQTYLLKGELNKSLVRPINPYLDTINMHTRGATIIIFPIITLIAIILISFGDYTNFYLAAISFFTGTILNILFFSTIYSTSFFLKFGNTIAETLRRITYTSDEFTPKMFETTPFRNFFYLIPTSIACYFTIEILNGRTQIIQSFIPEIIMAIISLIISLFILWHFGLKKYEGYN